MSDNKDGIELSERELLIAKEAARIAMTELSNQFYQQVGRTVVTKMLIWVGLMVIGFGVAKGWIKLP